jgi:hypothetical protein
MESHLENSKYYLPEISEFYVGFEYYHGFNSEQDLTLYIVNKTYDFKTILNEINNEIVRVKYLDKDDIESLGFKHDQTTKDGAYFYYGTMMDKKEILLHCHNGNSKFDYEDYTKIVISDLTEKFSDNTLFDGIIKNKSELKKLIRQLEII